MSKACGIVTNMLEATRRGKADGIMYARQRLARVFSTSEGASGMLYAPCWEMSRNKISSGVTTMNTQIPTKTILRPAK